METLRGNETVSSFYDYRGVLQICLKTGRNVGSLGVFLGDNPLNFMLPPTLCQLFIIILMTRLLQFFLKPLRTPKFICNILAGIILGPSFLGRNKTFTETLFPARQSQFLVVISSVGVSYFCFLVGIKMDVLMTIRAAKSTWRLGVIPFLACFVVVSALLSLYYHDDQNNMTHFKFQVFRVMLSATMSAANFPVMCEALTELNLITTELGQIAMSSSIMNDILQWLVTFINRIIASSHVQIPIMYLTGLAIFMFFCIFMLRPTIKRIVRSTPVGKPVKEFHIVFILLGALVTTGISDLIGMAITAGPLLYGLAMPSGPPLATTIVDKSEVIITEVLLPFFFLTIGIKTDLFVLVRNWRKFLMLQGIFLVGDLVKVVAYFLVSLTYNIKGRHGMVLGLMMNIKGITQLITIFRMTHLKLLDEEMFNHVVFSVVVMTAIITPLVKLLYMHCPRMLNVYGNNLLEGEILTIQNTVRNSELRIVTCVHREESVRGIATLLEACNPVIESPLFVYVIHLVELLGKSTPILLPINYSKNKKFLSVNYPNTNHIMRAFENYSKKSSGPITIIPFVNVAPYKSMHNAVCNLAQDKMVPLLIIPFHENDHIDLNGHMDISIRKLNVAFQARAPCTLGILVDRYSQLGGSKDSRNKLYFDVGIFFIGGPDDREALSLGIRMSERAHTRLSLFRFVMMNKNKRRNREGQVEEEEESYMENQLDEDLIDKYKGARFRGGNVSWYEIIVADGEEVLEEIRGLEGSYDLVMVGRRHNIGGVKDEEMTIFIENVEILGVVGDMLSSTEFCIGMVPVLVVQCGGDKVGNLDRTCSVSNMSRRYIV